VSDQETRDEPGQTSDDPEEELRDTLPIIRGSGVQQ
jgi:hypothetical protein